MARLKDRNRQIPNGMTFYQPETKWSPPPYASFWTIVDAVISHRQGNPWLIQKNGWSTDREAVANEVDAFNAGICERMGWIEYFLPGGSAPSPPISLPPLNPLQSLRNVAAGAETLFDWLGEGATPVSNELAASRAAVCADCPQNKAGSLSDWFTERASNAILSQLEKRKELNLSTPSDGRLNICAACDCPLKLKVHVPLVNILKRIQPKAKARLDSRCWILKESQ